MDAVSLFAIFLIILSPAIGAFLAVLVDRLPRGEDVVRPRSRCRSCRTLLRPLDLVPLASFISLRGTCRSCRAPIPAFTFYVELLAVGAAILAVLAGGDALDISLAAVWLWLLITLAFCDLIWFRLPDVLSFSVAVVAFALASAPTGVGLANAVMGAVIGVAAFALIRWGYRAIRKRDGLGLGDVKLMLGLGAFSGPFDLPLLVLMAAVLTLAGAFACRKSGNAITAQLAMPFGTGLCAAAAVLWLMRAAS